MANVPPYGFGISEFTTWPWSFEDDVERYARLGADAIEVCEFKLDQARIPEQLPVIGERGLSISSVQPVVRTLFPSQSQSEPADVRVRMDRFCRTIDSFGSHAAGVPFVTNSGIAPDGNIQYVLDMAVPQYRRVADYAAERGAQVALEPLNAAIMNVESVIWTLEQAVRLVEAVDRPNFGICLDTWNVWQNAGIVDAIVASGERTYCVQVSDWRTPRSFQDRLVPGDGEIPLPALLRAIHDSGYRGPYVVEIFSGGVPDSLWEGDLEEVVRRSRAGLDAAWAAAFAA